jgi:hypothetical protein
VTPLAPRPEIVRCDILRLVIQMGGAQHDR